MKVDKLTRWLTSFLVIILCIVLQTGNKVFAQPKQLVPKITNFSITLMDGTIPSDGFLLTETFRLNLDWDLSDYGKTLKEGDYFTIVLPKDFIFPENTIDFDAKDLNGEVWGKISLASDQNGGGGGNTHLY